MTKLTAGLAYPGTVAPLRATWQERRVPWSERYSFNGLSSSAARVMHEQMFCTWSVAGSDGMGRFIVTLGLCKEPGCNALG